MAITQTFDAAPSASVVLEAGEGPDVALPDGFAASAADYARAGSDLILTAPDGAQVVVRGFFDAETAPDLTVGDSVRIAAETAVRLAASPAAGQVAQAVPLAETDDSIGIVDTVEGPVTVTRADGTTEALADGDPLFLGDVIATGPDAALGVILADDTTFSMGADGRMTLDELVYDPGTQEGSAVLSLLQGTAVFVSGQIAKTDPEAMTLATPIGTIGIRGTSLTVQWDGTDFTLINMPEVAPDGSVVVGEITFFSPTGEFYGVLSAGNSGWRWTPAAGGRPQVTQFTDEDVQDFAGGLLAALPTVEGGNKPAAKQAAEDEEGGDEASAEGLEDVITAAGAGEGEAGEGGDVGAFVQTQIGGAGDDTLGPIIIAPPLTPPQQTSNAGGGGGGDDDDDDDDPIPNPGGGDSGSPQPGDFGAEWLSAPWIVGSDIHLGSGAYGVHQSSDGDAMVNSGVTLQIGSEVSDRDASGYVNGDFTTYGTTIVTDVGMVGGSDDVSDDNALSVVSNGRLDVDGALHVNQDNVLIDYDATVDITGVFGVFDGASPGPGVHVTDHSTVTNSGITAIEGSSSKLQVDGTSQVTNQSGGSVMLANADITVTGFGGLANEGDLYLAYDQTLFVHGDGGVFDNDGLLVFGDDATLSVSSTGAFNNAGTTVNADQDTSFVSNYGQFTNTGVYRANATYSTFHNNAEFFNAAGAHMHVDSMLLASQEEAFNFGSVRSMHTTTVSINATLTNAAGAEFDVLFGDFNVFSGANVVNDGDIRVGDIVGGTGSSDYGNLWIAGTLTNNAGATITVADTLTVYQDLSFEGVLNNFGTINTGFLVDDGILNNFGTLNVAGTEIDVYEDYTNAAPGVIASESGGFSTSELTNSGTIYSRFTVTITNDLTNLAGAELTTAKSFFGTAYDINVGGTLTNHGVIEAGGRIGWALLPEDIVNTGLMTAVDSITADYSLTNSGVLTSGSAIDVEMGVLTNNAGGSITAYSIGAEDGIINSGSLAAGHGVFVDDGDLTNNAGGSIYSGENVYAYFGLVNQGTIVAGEWVEADGNVTNYGTIVADERVDSEGDVLNHTGARMTIGFRLEADGTLTNRGQLISHDQVNGKVGIINEGTMISGGFVKTDFGTLTNATSGVLLAGGQVDAETGFDNYGIADIRQFVLVDAGNLINNTGAEMTVGEYLNIDGDITNRGDLNVTGYADTDAGGDVVNDTGAAFTVGEYLSVDGDVTNRGVLDVDNYVASDGGGFTNEETGTASVGNYLSVEDDFINHGTMDVVSFVETDGNFENSGTLEVGFIFAVDGTFENSGSIETVGSLTLPDDTNTVVFGADGQGIQVGSILDVDGILDLSVDDGASVSAGDTFAIFEFGSLTGRFERIDGLLQESDGLLLDPVFDSDSFDVTARTINSRVGTADFLVGSASDDVFTVDGGGDVLFGQDGDDRFTLGDGTFHYVNGGDGFDRVFADFDLDLTALRDELLKDLELIDISSGTGGNAITLEFSDVVAATDSSNELYIGLDSGDAVDIGSGWSGPTPDSHEGVAYEAFTQTVGSETATVYVEVV